MTRCSHPAGCPQWPVPNSRQCYYHQKKRDGSFKKTDPKDLRPRTTVLASAVIDDEQQQLLEAIAKIDTYLPDDVVEIKVDHRVKQPA